jgi:hypothetical protein
MVTTAHPPAWTTGTSPVVTARGVVTVRDVVAGRDRVAGAQRQPLLLFILRLVPRIHGDDSSPASMDHRNKSGGDSKRCGDGER